MTTPTNDRQTSERERLAYLIENPPGEDDASIYTIGELLDKCASQLRADERLDAEIAALRAENEALRTVTYDDLLRGMAAYEYAAGEGWKEENIPMNWAGIRDPCIQGIRAALQSFIRSKETRRATE